MPRWRKIDLGNHHLVRPHPDLGDCRWRKRCRRMRRQSQGAEPERVRSRSWHWNRDHPFHRLHRVCLPVTDLVNDSAQNPAMPAMRGVGQARRP